MKRWLLFILLLLSVCSAHSATYTWTGSALDGKWNTANNWSPTSVPGAADNVVFSGITVTVEMDVIPATTPFTYTINSLLITANANVTLQRTQGSGGDRILQLASTGASPKGLQIDNGSSLTIDAVNSGGTLDYSLALTGGAGVTGEISGNLYIKATGSGIGGTEIDLQDDASHFASLVVKNLGVIKYFDDTDNTSPSTGSYLTMENGSTYEIEKNGGSFPPGIWNPNSLAKVFNMSGSNAPTFAGTTYGNLDWNCPNQSNYSLTADMTFNNVNLVHTKAGSGSAFRITNTTIASRTLTINGNLDITSDSKLEITGSGVTTGGGTLILKGNLNNAGILTTSGITGTTNDFILNGTSNQNITNNGTLSGAFSGSTAGLTFIMNNPAGATLLSPVTLPAKLTLTNGKIKTTSTNVLSMSDNTPSPTGGTSTSFVEGPMKKGGHDDTFTFPVGKGSIYSPITYYSGSLTTTDTVRAEYIRGNPQSTYGTSYDPTNTPYHIDHISIAEYWKLQKMTGAAVSHNVTLFFTQYSFCKIFATTFVTSYHPGTMWQSCGTNSFTSAQTGTSGSYVFGYINTTGQDLDDSIFTLGTSDAFSVNPLPINLLSFNASKLTNTKSSINWELAACCSAAARFELQRAGSNKDFKTVTTIGGSETNVLYNYTDNGLQKGINYYRLKMTDADGTVSYSKVVAVLNGVEGLLLTSLAPTVVSGSAALTVTSSTQQRIDIIISDMGGRIVYRRNHSAGPGNTTIVLPTGNLAAGIYRVYGLSAFGKTAALSFLKQ